MQNISNSNIHLDQITKEIVDIMTGEKCIIMILGTAQDAGVPQLGCDCSNCTRAFTDNKFKRLVTSIGIINQATGKTYIIDSTPNFAEQFINLHKLKTRYISKPESPRLKRVRSRLDLDGIFLTHAHMGHYFGLVQLGKEACATLKLPVFATSAMRKFITGNRPFKELVKNHNIELHSIIPGKPCLNEKDLIITPISVPHRHEFSDTVGFIIQGPNKRLLYIPDINNLTRSLLNVILRSDLVLFDGTFFDKGEISSRRKWEPIAHPPIIETMNVLGSYVRRTKIYYTHFNHTNPVLNPESDEAKEVKGMGFGITPEGWTFGI